MKMNTFIICYLLFSKASIGSAFASHCLQLLPNLSSIGTRGRASDAHRPGILVPVILGIGLPRLDLRGIRFSHFKPWRLNSACQLIRYMDANTIHAAWQLVPFENLCFLFLILWKRLL